MKQWTEQAGYPMINVVKVNDEFIISQERCLMDTPDKIIDSSRWYVGITYTTESSKNFEDLTLATWCKPTMDNCILSAPQDPGWFIFNIQSAGFYRVNYDTDNWSLLIRQLKETPEKIHVLNRAQLIDDSFFLARADQLHYSFPLRISSYLKIEDDVLPWYSVIHGYSYLIERMRRNDTEYSDLRECVSNLAGIIYKKTEDKVVKENNTDHVILTSWNAFSVWACELNNEMCIQSVFDYYTKWQNGEKIPSDIRDAAFCVGVHITNKTSTWEQMLNLYKTTRSPSEKQSAQTAMACTEDDMLLSRYLNYIFEGEDGPIRKQDYNDVFTAVSSTPKGLEVLIDFLVQNLDRITKKLTDGNNTAIFIYSICASKAALDSEITKIKNLKDDPKTPENLRKEFNESYKQVDNNLYWFNKYHEIVNQNTGCSQGYTTTDEPQKTSTQKTQSTTEIIIETSTEPTIRETTLSERTDTSESIYTETSDTTWSERIDTTTHVYTDTTIGDPTKSTHTESTTEHSPGDTTSSEHKDTTTHIYPETESAETTVTKYTEHYFKQTLLVIPRGSRADEVKACIKASYLWPFIEQLSLNKNMRVYLGGDVTAGKLSELLLKIGNGDFPELTGKLVITKDLGLVVTTLQELIVQIYPDISDIKNKSMDSLCERAILTPKNNRAAVINEILLKSFKETDMEYKSIDMVLKSDDTVHYPVEFLNALNPPGFPAHRLVLKVGTPIMLLQNLHPPKLCNGCAQGESTFIPLLSLNYPLKFKRLQFPIKVSCAMTINKSQGQSLKIAEFT
ncbi:thyrotropin-releasing hormone-degrading ectoenzyme-like [Acyrthosiphon pisum]|uniref:ATP-dependent DNA helicase n=1 Tax=Acyrthosiphon pisum TaxID=7029 RepID=A0A8R2JX17_ACYPI|nr:thyrotropin-releasing hormone-degrading ectoenzyme-like [Acyrthosiphon pisum]